MSATSTNRADLTAMQLSDMRHMLGMSERKSRWGYRNYYAASANDPVAEQSFEQLISLGLLVRGRKGDGIVYYHCTKKGCEVAGLNKKQTERAINGD